jgi:hypothetical protein
MIDVVLIYDPADDADGGDLGYFFAACATHIKSHLGTDPRLNLTEVVSEQIEAGAVQDILIKVKEKSYIVIVYSHGLEDKLFIAKSGFTFLSSNENSHLLENSLFYSWACLCGLNFGPSIISKGSKGFIGYNKTVWAGSLYIDIFIECANYGLLLFIQGATIEQSFLSMKDKYIEKTDELSDIDFWASSFLERNKNALIPLYSNPSLRLVDLV